MRSRPLFFFLYFGDGVWVGSSEQLLSLLLFLLGVYYSPFRLLVRAKTSFVLRIPPYLRHLPGSTLR